MPPDTGGIPVMTMRLHRRLLENARGSGAAVRWTRRGTSHLRRGCLCGATPVKEEMTVVMRSRPKMGEEKKRQKVW